MLVSFPSRFSPPWRPWGRAVGRIRSGGRDCGRGARGAGRPRNWGAVAGDVRVRRGHPVGGAVYLTVSTWWAAGSAVWVEAPRAGVSGDGKPTKADGVQRSRIRKEDEVREPNLELWRRRREELEQEAEMNRLGRELRAAQRGASPRTGTRDGGLMGRIGGKLAAVPRVLGEKGTTFRPRSRRQHPPGCAN
jgi:hypothetical protein